MYSNEMYPLLAFIVRDTEMRSGNVTYADDVVINSLALNRLTLMGA